jgi:hypothetical protein
MSTKEYIIEAQGLPWVSPFIASGPERAPESGFAESN